MINFALFTGMFFILAFLGQYRLKKLELKKTENVKKIRSIQLVTMLSYFTGSILCFVYLFNNQ